MEAAVKIRALVMDVDGTLTDGGIYIGNEGEAVKRFHVKDGYGIREILPKLGITPVIITGRESPILTLRCKELGIENVIQGSRDKVKTLLETLDNLGISAEETAYMGDDLNDYEAMKMAGVRGCPQDAAAEVKKISEYVAQTNGGYGAVREFIEWIGQGEIDDGGMS